MSVTLRRLKTLALFPRSLLTCLSIRVRYLDLGCRSRDGWWRWVPCTSFLWAQGWCQRLPRGHLGSPARGWVRPLVSVGLHTAKTRVPVWHQGALYCPGLSCGTHVLRTHTFGTLHPDTASLKKRSDGRKKRNSVCNFGVYDCGPLDVSISIIEFMIRCENLNKMFPAL